MDQNYSQPTIALHSETSMPQRNMGSMSTAPTIDPTPPQFWQLDELRLFYQPQNDDNFYHICKMILQDFISLDDNYEHGFFYQCAAVNYYVTCKLFSHSLIVNILNKEIYGMDIDINLRSKELISLHRKLNLEQNLKQILPFYLLQHQIPESETRSDFNENTNFLYGHVENNSDTNDNSY